METEIEIKFLFSSQFESELYDKINAQRFISSKKQLLHNVYFDTANRLLREMDMGLRVRSSEGRSVQTIKTAGRVIGGLHQRPEYNEPIQGLRPELARFNSKIWPQGCDLKALENELVPIFSTDFERQTWLLEMADATLIEVAYDRGFIETNQGKLDICEIELELIKGDEKQLFVFGNEIAALPHVRLGNVSKAQRGYMLTDSSSFKVKPLSCSPINASMSVEQALLTNMQHGLRHIQYHENCYIESLQDEALNELLKGLKFLHQNLNLFNKSYPNLLKAQWVDDLHWLARSFSWLDTRLTYHYLLANKGYYLRKLPKYKLLLSKLQEQDNKLPDQQMILELLTSTRYCQFILKLTQWLIFFEKSTFSSEKTNSVNDFACEHLTRAWDELRLALKDDENNKLLSSQGLLESNLLIGLSVDNLFSQDKSVVFHSPWLDIKQGLEELAMINVIADFAEQEEETLQQAGYYKWIERKEESLLH
ncbi:MAG: CYTH domain-containing protein, partial [Psychromonas sp.]|nr:CYTH domain-containing protein [Psychromonas sp.]